MGVSNRNLARAARIAASGRMAIVSASSDHADPRRRELRRAVMPMPRIANRPSTPNSIRLRKWPLVSTWLPDQRIKRQSTGWRVTHSLRRTKASLIYKATGNLRAVQILLGHTKIEHTVRYLGVDVEDALELAEHTEV